MRCLLSSPSETLGSPEVVVPMAEEADSLAVTEEEKPGRDGADGGASDAEKPASADLAPAEAPTGGGFGDETKAVAEGRSFSQLLAGAMASPTGSSRSPTILTVPVVAVPCLLTPASLIESPTFPGQFAMTHQAVLAAVTAQAQMQMQVAYPSPSETKTNSFPQPISPTVSPMLLQQISPASETHTDDIYHWRKYGQKQVKNTRNSRSYYRCAASNCAAKKKVERSLDGKINEVIYRGKHNHNPPQRYRYTRDKGSQSGGPSGENETLDHPSNEPNESDPSTCKTVVHSGNDPLEQRLYCSSDCEKDIGNTTKKGLAEEPDRKQRLTESCKSPSTPVPKTVREYIVQTEIDARHLSDGYRWRKYGQKMVKGNSNPRSYYRCTHDGCTVRKHVERSSHDAKALLITYEGKHNHDQPTPKYASDQQTAEGTASGSNKEVVTSSSQMNSSSLATEVKELSGEKTLEFGGDKALESAESLTSTKDANGRTNSDGVVTPLIDKKATEVSVENT
ncbi:probable WRKY transcription factor 4 isoform X1 [Zingiber officinale]|uniref:probable WRKY transcription factor 4 isoform X1 n=1 Tax=Zingiber officinale TaxID=94328 RepID=UPI001C4ADFCB|nr:probable WRKY transcription factor 4 isoform X1 [Zingiber officinale]